MDVYIEDLMATLAAAGERTVLHHAGTDTSGAALLARICRYARALDGLGVGREDLVALLAPNTPDAVAVRYASHVIGAEAVFLSVPPDPERRERLVAQMAPRLLVVFPETAHLVPARVDAPIAAVGPVPGVPERLDVRAAGLPAHRYPSGPGRVAWPWWSPPAGRPACRRAAVALRRVHRGGADGPPGGPAAARQRRLGDLTRTWWTRRCWAAAAWCWRTGSSRPGRWTRSARSGSRTCSWSSRSWSS